MKIPDESFRSRELLESAIYSTLETYSNVHRGSGFTSVVTTRLYEEARKAILNYLGISESRYVVIFCSPRKVSLLVSQLGQKHYYLLDSNDTGLNLGVTALVVKKRWLPKGVPVYTGGGAARLMSAEWEVWAKAPDRFEAGTPAIINIIAFARALAIIKHSGDGAFGDIPKEAINPAAILSIDELIRFSGEELFTRLKETLIGKDLKVPTLSGPKTFVNFDNSASTRTFKPVWDVYRKVLFQPQSVQRLFVEETRKICSGFFGFSLDNYDIHFTSNTTEAINLVAESFRRESSDGFENLVVVSKLEHSSNDLPWRATKGLLNTRLSIDNEGFIDWKELETILEDYNEKSLHGNKRIGLVAISGASNVLGICNHLNQAASIAHRFGAKLLVDGAQLAAHRKIDMEADGIDYLAFSGHKVYAPFGAGALIARKGCLHYNTDEIGQIKSGGEENAAGIAALGKALNLLQRIGIDVVEAHEKRLLSKLLSGLSQIKGLKVHGVKDPDSPGFERKAGVVAMDAGKTMSNVVAGQLSLNAGIGIRYGCHCAHILVKHLVGVGPKLEKFQKRLVTWLPAVQLPGVARVSLGIENDEAQIDTLLKELKSIVDKTDGNNRISTSKEVKAETERQAIFKARLVLGGLD